MKIKTIKKTNNAAVFDMTVDQAHHYILENGVITHNSGLEYCASTIVFLSKKKNKDKDNQTTGAIITAILKKARHSVENKKVETLLDYQKGLDRYFGIIDIAEKFGIIKKTANKYEFPNGDKAFESAILKTPEKYFTKEVLDAIDSKCADEFLYGKTNDIVPVLEEV